MIKVHLEDAMSKELPLDETHQERTLNKAVSDVLKASVVGLLAVVITAIPFEQFVVQFAGISYEEFRGGMPTLYLKITLKPKLANKFVLIFLRARF